MDEDREVLDLDRAWGEREDNLFKQGLQDLLALEVRVHSFSESSQGAWDLNWCV